ncbi:MAG: cache domain-containing protein, partial [Sphingobacteriales bacterium]
MKKYLLLIITAFSLITAGEAQLSTANGNSVLDNNNFYGIIGSGNLSVKTNNAELKSYVKLFKPSGRIVGIKDSRLTSNITKQNATHFNQFYQQDTTRKLVQLVKEATELIRVKGEAAFNDLRLPGSRWRRGETYIFVLDPKGNMLVHADPQLEGKNQLNLKDINGKPIIRGLLAAATTFPNKPEGWYHYQWPVPGGLLPRWKSSYVQLVRVPSGKSYIVGSGMYNDRMERDFVIDAVKDAVGQIEKNDKEAFRLFHDPSSPFMVKDAYIFVIDMNGVDLVNPA